MTDTEVKKALECCKYSIYEKRCADCLLIDEARCIEYVTKSALDLINRLQAENKKFKDRQKPTGASGYKIENGKVVFFTNMLGGCKIVKENLEDVVKTLNELLHEAYSKDEIAFALKCKTEENESLKAEVERLKEVNDSFTDIGKLYSEVKAEAYKECIEKVKEKSCKINMCHNDIVVKTDYQISGENLDNLLNELVGDKSV